MRFVFDARYIRTDHHDGISRYTAQLLTALANLTRNDPRVQLAALINDPAQLHGIPHVPHLTGPAPTSALEAATSLVLNRHRPDVVFSPMQTMGSLGRRYRLILTLHDLIYYEHPQPPTDLPLPIQWGWRAYHKAWWPQRVALNRADAVVTVSQTSRSQILEHRLTKRAVHVVPNAASSPAISQREALKRLGARGKDLIYMGSFLPYKNVETLIRAAEHLPEYTLHLLSRISPRREEQLRALTGPADNVIFHRGVSEQRYQQLLASCAALLSASRAEGYGLPIVEAFAGGAPVVCSDIPIFREVAADAAGFAPADDPVLFAARVRELETSAVARNRVLAGLNTVHAHSWSDSAETLLNLARELHARR